MKRTRLLSLLLLPATLAGCSASQAPPEPSPTEHEPGPPLFGSLQLRDHTVTIWLGEDGPIYTVETNEGELLATRIDEQYLADHFPGIHETLGDPLALLATGY